MSKGIRHTTSGNKKTSHYEFKKRCQVIGCNKRAKYFIDNKYLCKVHGR